MAITDLTGTSWELVSFAYDEYQSDGWGYNINFVSNNENFNYINFQYTYMPPEPPYFPGDASGSLEYFGTNTVTVSTFDLSSSGYAEVSSDYQIILITGGDDATDTDLINWLEANGTLTLPEPSGYEVTFVTNGGTSVTKLENVEELPTPLPTTTKANNIFVGWFYDSEFEVQAFSGDTISSNITLYAKWYANMSDFYQDVADAIRSKTGETGPIKHTDFAYKIKNIQGAIELTQAQYDALAVKDANTYYLITG